MAGKWTGKTWRWCSADSDLVWRLRSGMDYWRAEHSTLEGEKKQGCYFVCKSGGLTKKKKHFCPKNLNVEYKKTRIVEFSDYNHIKIINFVSYKFGNYLLKRGL